MELFRSRIAPTPSGFLHRGNLYNFLLTALITHHNQGELRLRIDDMDAQRVQPAYLEDIFKTLNWLGISWQQGPETITEHEQHFSQRHRMLLYESVLSSLINGVEVYACTCSRKELVEHGQRAYSGICRNKRIPMHTPHAAWRVHVPSDTEIRWKDEAAGTVTVNLGKQLGDFIIRRKDGLPAYQLVSLADDLLYQTNYIVRGADLMESTAAQKWLAQKLDNKDFSKIKWYHHPLLMQENGEKLSKSAAGNTAISIRQQESDTGQIIAGFVKWMGWNIKAQNIDELFRNSKTIS